MTCNNDTEGEWDYNAWNLKIDEITSDSKCTIVFAGNLSKEDYQNYIDAGIALRRNTYRGKELKLDNDFWASIQNGTFDDIYVGDYIVSHTSKKYDSTTSYSEETVKWLVADIDNYLYTGDNVLTQHHLTIIPAKPLMQAPMNTTATAGGGYYGGKMVSGCNAQYEVNDIKKNISLCQSNSILDKVYKDYIKPDFEDTHILTYDNLLTTAIIVDEDNYRPYLTGGESRNWDFISDRRLDLMSEMNIYGATFAASNYLDPGLDTSQYAIFRLKPELKYADTKGNRFIYWLKDVASSNGFAVSDSRGAASAMSANEVYGVRPRFLIG